MIEVYVSDETINIGSLYDPDSDFELCTLENPWLDNEPYVSCIPKGNYKCHRVDSPRYGDTFQVMNVEAIVLCPKLERVKILMNFLGQDVTAEVDRIDIEPK